MMSKAKMSNSFTASMISKIYTKKHPAYHKDNH